VPLLGQDADDVEWYFTPDDLIVQFRAERRSGRADFGTNRQRLEDDGWGGSWRISKQQKKGEYMGILWILDDFVGTVWGYNSFM
jgi:hypothetical protein